MAEFISTIDARASQNKWTCMSVQPDGDAPSYTYSIGFDKNFAAPNLLLIGFDPEICRSVIGEIASRLRKAEIRLPDHETRMGGLIIKFDVLLRPVPEPRSGAIAKAARALSETGVVPLLHVILPDAGGRLPGDAGCDPAYEAIQDINRIPT